MFKKRKNLNIRQRRLSEEEPAAEGEAAGTNSNDDSNSNLPPAGKKEKKKAKEKEPKKQSILSFEDELEADDGIMFQEKKSSLSYKLRKEMKKERKEKRREEKEKQRQAEGKDKFREKDKNGGPTVSELDELGIRIVNGREAESIGAEPGDSDSEEDTPGQHKFRPKGAKTSQSLDPWKKILQSGQIPDANMIHAIRKQRQQAREQGDMIPIDDTVRVEESKGRLVRDDDNDRSDDEEGESRMDFSVNHQARDRQQRREAFIAAQDDDGTDNSDHEREWEKQQLLKAGASTKVAGCEGEGNQDSQTDPSASSHFTAPVDNGALAVAGAGSIVQPEPRLWGQESLIPASSSALPRPSNYQAEGIIKRLQDSRTSLEEVYRRHRKEADTVEDDLVVCKCTISLCSKEEQPLTSIFQFYQDIRGYVTDLRDCLNEKVPEISSLEEQVYALYRQRAQKMVQRRRQDVKDQNDEFSPFAGKGAMGDEYRTRRAAEREGRRTRRRREREKRGDSNHHDGMSTDDEESQSEIQLMQSDLEHIAAEARKIFEDVEDDFSQLKRIMTKFEEWKAKDGPTYSDAYVSYNLPKIFAPYIRLQMLLWNPLMKDSESVEVERMKWFNLLLLYGTGDAPDDDPRHLREDSDRKLMSHLVEKIVLVKLKELVGCWWDPLSHTQTVRLVNMVRHYAEAYPSLNPSSKPLRELTHAIINKIRDAIDNDIFIPMFPKNVYDNKNSGVSLFFQRQFWVAWKLLSSTLMWHKVLSDSVIHDLAVRSLLNLYLLPALNLATEINPTDALDKCRNVINALPRSWVKSEGTHVFLGRLEDFLIKLSEKLDPTTHTPALKEVCDLLKSIGATAQAEKIAYKYL
ncbi:PAX3- and PAX7-binding protein 1-like isoform X1 [Eriocheir sinensis]|uniref:PAX3- and PAX7-binding protein 1-like isoform X1 n=1 Tax=Eriocheir sinensis TaxID=95602 RepID=UPI0021C92162|nr:PAX3- and PAX7-binding protein 1-like isoform X1 [Eriocheir sinensis]